MTAIRLQAAAAPRSGVRMWLLALIFLTFAMVLVGGATRLTESGLSITEWNLVMGAIPPLNAADWQAAFDLYRQSPQYDLLNQGMSLGDFKAIYWWEWAHRELGRFIGLVYVAGLLWFLIRRAVGGRTAVALVAIGLLLGTQGLVGWIMVASGLKPGMTAVEPVRLTLHLSLACLFFVALVVAFVRLGGAGRESATASTRWLGWGLVALGMVQVALGGLVGGHDAGLTYNSWPLMDGRVIPTGLGRLEPAWRNLLENLTLIQFNHRIGGYILAATICAYGIVVRRDGFAARERGLLMALLVVAQVVIGIATLISAVPIGLALMHQGMAFVLMLTLAWNAAAFRR